MSKQLETRKRSLNEMQKQFIHYLVYEGKNPTESARLAGYRHPKQSANVLTRTPNIMNSIQQTRQRIYQTDLSSLAIATLKSVMLDVDAPSGSRVQASRTALELAGDLGSKSENDTNNKSLSELSPDELSNMIDQWEQERSNLAKNITNNDQDQ